uniref:Abnormal cell migration protein 18-like fibronectin type I domain-containing protein n=1 Tax=Romanomermis culicivorax TaxID=13658 RepID=A0A915HH61_ROMCU
MHISYIICILCLALSCSWAAESCDQEGFQSQKGNFWYTCTNKQMVPVACISSQGDRIDEGTKYQDAQTEYQCKRDGGGVLALTSVSCISNGQPIPIDQTFTDDSGHQLKCVKDSSGLLKLTMIGCIGDDGQPQPTGGTVTRDGVVYDCRTNGKEYAPGEEIVQSSVWFKCEKSKSGDLAPIKRASGCQEKMNDRIKEPWR